MGETIEISFDELGLKKPLDKMTAKELRQLAMDKIPMITGASSMAKEEILAEIKRLFGLEDEDGKGASPYRAQISELKKQIKQLREQKTELESRKEKEYMRRKINKLKKRTRRLAAAV